MTTRDFSGLSCRSCAVAHGSGEFEPSAEPLGANAHKCESSAYFDWEPQGAGLGAVGSLLPKNLELRREVDCIRRLGEQLNELGADILSEPVPEFLLDAVRRLRLT